MTPAAFKAPERAKISSTLIDYQAVKAAAMSYNADTAAWPADGSTGAGLVNTDSVAGWDGPYLERWPKAKWGSGAYTFQSDGGADWNECTSPATGDSARYLELAWIPAASITSIDAALDPATACAQGAGKAGRVRWATGGTTVQILIQTAVTVNY